MAYTDSNYNTRVTHYVSGTPQIPLSLASNTYTASGMNTIGAGTTGNNFVLPAFFRPTKLLNVIVYVGTAQKAGLPAAGVTLNVMNGASVAATVTVSTAAGTAGAYLVGTGIAGANIFGTAVTTGSALVGTSSVVPTIQVVGSATASADTYGAFALAFETQEQFEA